MLLNKIMYLLIIFAVCSCAEYQNTVPVGNSYLVKFKKSPGVEQFENLESYIFSKRSGQLKSIVLIYNDLNKKEADYIDDMMYRKYGFRSVTKYQPGSGEHVVVLLEYGKVTAESCYKYELSDFNWYNSSADKISDYSNAIICDTVDNDTSARM